ncbi:hypothetical protein D3C85_1315260 [compost metagenome]
MDRLERQARAIPAFDAEGLRHEPVQGKPGQHRCRTEQHEQPAPGHPLQQQGTDQRTKQRRQQGDIGQQGHHPHCIGFAERLVECRVADRHHKAQANALQQAQQVEQLDALHPEGGDTGQAEERAAAQQQRTTAVTVGQRADQPLQQHATEQVEVQGMGDEFGAGVELTDHHRHGRHHHVAGEVGKQFEQRQGHGETKRP